MSPSTIIEIDDVQIRAGAGESISVFGKLSEKDLAGIKISLRAAGPEGIGLIEDLTSKTEVNVKDPFVEREYLANMRLNSTSYQDGVDAKRFTFTVTEIDHYPDVKKIEIDNNVFDVIKYKEKLQTEDKKGIIAHLKITELQNELLTGMFDKESVSVKRIGFDQNAKELRFGGMMFWSKHEEEGEIFYKRIVRLFPLDLEGGRNFLASGHIQDALVARSFLLTIIIEKLLKELTGEGIITEEKKDDILKRTTLKDVPEERLRELEQSLYMVADAEEED